MSMSIPFIFHKWFKEMVFHCSHWSSSILLSPIMLSIMNDFPSNLDTRKCFTWNKRNSFHQHTCMILSSEIDFQGQASMVHLNARKMGWNFPIKVSPQWKQIELKLVWVPNILSSNCYLLWLRATSHMRLKAPDHCILRSFIGWKGWDRPSSLHSRRRRPISQRNYHGWKVYMGSYMVDYRYRFMYCHNLHQIHYQEVGLMHILV